MWKMLAVRLSTHSRELSSETGRRLTTNYAGEGLTLLNFRVADNPLGQMRHW
jgi:hypothetical protein